MPGWVTVQPTVDVAGTLLASAAASALVLQRPRKARTAQNPVPAAPAGGNGHAPDGVTMPSPETTQ